MIRGQTWSAWLERSSPTAFLVAGGLMLGHAGLSAVRAFTEVPTPVDVFAPTGHLLGLIGLLGLSPTLARHSRRWARGGSVVATLTAVAWLVISVSQLGSLTTVAPALAELGDVVYPLTIGSTVISYLLYGVTTLRSERYAPQVGLLLVTPAVLLTILVSSMALTGTAAIGGFVVGGGIAGTQLALGRALRTRAHRPDRRVSATEATA